MGGQAAPRSSQRTAGGAWGLADLDRTTLALALPPELPGKLLMGTLAALGVTAWEAESRRHLWEPQAFRPHLEIEREFPAGAGGTRCPWGVRQRDHGRPRGGPGPQRGQNGGGRLPGSLKPPGPGQRCSLQLLPGRLLGVVKTWWGPYQLRWAVTVGSEGVPGGHPRSRGLLAAQGLRGHQGGSRWLQGWPWK